MTNSFNARKDTVFKACKQMHKNLGNPMITLIIILFAFVFLSGYTFKKDSDAKIFKTLISHNWIVTRMIEKLNGETNIYVDSVFFRRVHSIIRMA